MGERAHRAYEEDAKRTFRALPLKTRVAAYLRATIGVLIIAMMIFCLFAYPQLRAIWVLFQGK